MTIGLVCALQASAALAESVVLNVSRNTALSFMRAATPYTLQVETAGFQARFTLYNPRQLRFEKGKIRLTVDCRGEPFGVNAVLEPTINVYFDHVRNAYMAKVEELPVTVASLGTVRLDQFLDPIVLPVAFTQEVDVGVPGMVVDTVIREIKVLDESIEARADLVFRKVQDRPAGKAR